MDLCIGRADTSVDLHAHLLRQLVNVLARPSIFPVRVGGIDVHR